MQATQAIDKQAGERGVGRRTFLAAAWLGWQIEANWADPIIFFIYSVIKPLSGAAILVVMYSVITNGAFEDPMFAYIYLGNAFYIYVAAVLSGVSWSVIDDREVYRMLKYIYIAPVNIPVYLLGRGFAKFVFGSLAVFITIVVGVLFLDVPLDLTLVNWPLFVISLVMGIVMLAMMGLALGSVMLLIVNNANFMGEAVAGALYLFSGAIFPLSVLPAWLQPIGYVVPISYWLELIRRALVGGVAQSFPTFSQFSNLQLLGILAGLTAVFTVLGFVIFRYCDHQARERGYIDRVTNY
ncbi:MAG TPA: ABC transporter permease [Anaerolineales bacterium]|nr:ABC transporter permease [Anaerolineales bacterium]HRQ91570.1 ABC transporter permease [Anaerolineales bacterium]